ncbi:hypothetical protein KKE19_00400 [Patescibacteria group bacterium]|nr:hypothetical protein [Patescibacteria group bacterium]MBU4367634.1 hypothetical protein [Patescibacteria group bacterium]MBU4462114.1 hypothetical protein [Patescibacteria group bacterium]MCG2700433.1 hypothetical protein [Candidatus Parcubacteria bacterium]
MGSEIKITIKLPSIEGIKKLSRFLFKNLKMFFWFVIKDIKTKKKRGILALVLAGLFFWWFGISAGLLWFLFLMFLFYGWENRIIAVFALISLASCPVLLSFKKDSFAETMAVYAYFFLVMTVVLQIVEYKRHPELYNESDNEEK